MGAENLSPTAIRSPDRPARSELTGLSRPTFHQSSPTISIAETVLEMHVGIFFNCKRISHWTTVLQNRTVTRPHLLATAMHKQDIDQVTAVPGCFAGE
jgi:hypothetical protein